MALGSSVFLRPIVVQANSTIPFSYIIKLKPNISTLVMRNDSTITSIKPVFVDPKDSQFKSVYVITTIESLSFIRSELSDSLIYIEPVETMKAGSVETNDPGLATDPTDTDKTWGLLKAHFTDAWAKTTGSASVIVAIIDTGIDATHEDLSDGQVGTGFDFVHQTTITFGDDSDDNGHGTLVAGVIGATANNFRGIVGTNWNITMMPVKALDSNGQGNSGDVASAIVWATDHGANIINMSLGGEGFGNDTTLSDAITYAYNKNVVIVAAGGNDVTTDGGNLDQNPVFPVCDDNGQNMIIGVAATDENDQKASFSNYGNACIDVSAPGKKILSTISIDPGTHLPAPNSYALASGTSLAVPFVSGEAALIKAYYPNATNKEIQDRIIKSADPIDSLNTTTCNGGPCAGLIGSGRINALAALDPNLIQTTIPDGSLVAYAPTSQLYYIRNGKKLPVDAFVKAQQFANSIPQIYPEYVLDPIPTGPPAAPLDGTLIRGFTSSTVYEVLNGLKQPITYQVFTQRNLSFPNVMYASDSDLADWITGNFLPPVDGTLVRAKQNKTVYWVLDGLLDPINYAFYTQKGLNIFPIVIIPDSDLQGYANGDALIR